MRNNDPSLPVVQGTTLSFLRDGREARLTVGSRAWYTWLDTATGFAYRGPFGSFTARKERAGNKRGDWYWRAYLKRGGKLHRAYLGRSADLTGARLDAVAARLTSQRDEDGAPAEWGAALLTAELSPPTPAYPQPPTFAPDPPQPEHSSLSLPSLFAVQLTSFVGREQELEAVSALLLGDEVRLLTLTGPGGVGKTRLALYLAAQLLARFPHGVFFVNLAPLRDPALVVSAIAQTLGVTENPGQLLIAGLQGYLRDREILLVLDNFEQVAGAAPNVGRLLVACPFLKVLVTSRAAIGLQTEQEFEVLPLAMPERNVKELAMERGEAFKRSNVQTLLRYGAIELFVQRASTLESDFELTDDNANAVVEVCRRVDGLPLAIELVAAHARLLSPQSILARLTHPLRLLTGGPQDAPSRHRTMRSTIEWSYRLLNEEEQRLFRCLSVFVGGFAVRVAEAVCNQAGDIGVEVDDPQAIEVLEGLEALVDKNLVRRLEQAEDGDRRLTMLETVREYAWEQLVASGEAEAMQRRHADYYLWLAERAEPQLDGPGAKTWLDNLNPEQANLRAVLSWLLAQKEAGASQDALRLLLDLWSVWDRRTHASEVQRWLEEALAHVGPDPSPLRSKALRRGSYVAVRLGDYPRARAWAERALEMARELGDKWEINQSLNGVAAVALMQGDYDSARSLWEACLAGYRELGDDDGIPGILNNLGEVARYQGDYQRAEGLYKESLGIFRTLEDKPGAMLGLENLGYSEYHLGRFQEARATLLEGIALAQEIESKMHVAVMLASTCGVILAEIDQSGVQDLREVEQAARLFGLAAELLESIGKQLEPLDQVEYDRNVATARARLGEEAFTRAWEEGRAMTLDLALHLATQPEFKGQSLRKQTPGGLTSREHEVAGLVTRGLSNEDIARRLVLSERTVEMHVSNALHKLGLTTRTQMATWVVEQGIASEPTQGNVILERSEV